MHNCDFEVDNCFWIQDANDDFDWVRSSGATDSAGTGPGADHTKGNEAGEMILQNAQE